MEELMRAFPELSQEEAKDRTPTFWVGADRIHDVLRFAKDHVPRIFLYDLTAIDGRRLRGQHDFIVVYHLFSLDRDKDVRLKVPLTGEHPAIPSAVDVFTNADWYEREVFDMFGVSFEAHPNLRRILMPPTWIGHPLRKDHPARATEMGRYHLPAERALEEEEAMRFRPEDGSELMFLNIGPQHPGTHGVFRIVLALDGERIVDAVPDIGFHHRGAEKMGERQTWHTFIPYTDRIDYLAGVQNNLAYLIAVEKLAGIEVPERAKIIRIMMAELFRISSHLVWYGTFAQDLGALSPVFYMFTDRERIFDIVQAVCGSRMHPSWFRIGGVAQDLPRGWDRSVSDFLEYMPRRLREYDVMVLGNSIFKARTKGVGEYTAEQALEWGVTGPGLRACGVPLDLRRARPYGGYDQLEFDVPTRDGGDAYARAEVRVEEIRQSLRIVKQCLDGMPSGPVNAEHPLATPPPKPKTLHDIETLIAHFLNVSWGPVMPKGEALSNIEAPKGINGYYVVSDGGTQPYRVRIRTPSFPHLQMLPAIARGRTIPDLMAILGSVDFVMGEVDR